MLFGRDVELSVGEIADRIGISQSTASQQLALLRRGGLLTSRRDGKTIYYRTDRERSLSAVAQLQAYISTCC